MMNIQRKNIPLNSGSDTQYAPFKIPPSLELSKLHRECSQFGSSDFLQKQCPCCQEFKRTKLKIGCSLSEIYNINEPVGIYFTYIKIMCVVLLLIMLVTGIYSVVQIVNQCSSDDGDSMCIYVYGIPITKIHAFFKVPLIALNGVVILFLYCVVAFMFFKISYLHQKNVCLHELPSDYSILMSNINHEAIQYSDVEQALKTYKIKDIIYTHQIKSYLNKLAKISLSEAKITIFEWKHMLQKLEKEKQKLRNLQNSCLHVKNKLILGQDLSLRTDKIIITFEEIQDKKRFQRQYRVGLCKTIFRTFCGGSSLVIADHPVYVQPLGQPNELIWENLEVTSKKRYFRILVSNFLSLLILFGSFVLITFLSKSQRDHDLAGDIIMSILFSVSIEATNYILTFVIEKLTHWQGRYTMTGQLSIKLYKKCFGFFLNTTFIPFSLFMFSLFDSDEDDLIRNILTLFFISNIISPIVGMYIHPKFLYKVYARRKIVKQQNLCLKTQIQSNKIFQKLDFMLDERYALVCQLYMNCLFYAAIFPFGILITIVGMIITYWSSKLWLINLCSMPKFSFKIGRHINIISCYFPCIYAFGYAANLYMVPNEKVDFDREYSLYIAFATIPLTLFFVFFGEKIAKKWIRERRKSVTQCLNRQKHTLTYKKLNPTSFLHEDLHQKIKNNDKNLWQNLVSYVIAKESHLLHPSNLSNIKSS